MILTPNDIAKIALDHPRIAEVLSRRAETVAFYRRLVDERARRFWSDTPPKDPA